MSKNTEQIREQWGTSVTCALYTYAGALAAAGPGHALDADGRRGIARDAVTAAGEAAAADRGCRRCSVELAQWLDSLRYPVHDLSDADGMLADPKTVSSMAAMVDSLGPTDALARLVREAAGTDRDACYGHVPGTRGPAQALAASVAVALCDELEDMCETPQDRCCASFAAAAWMLWAGYDPASVGSVVGALLAPEGDGTWTPAMARALADGCGKWAREDLGGAWRALAVQAATMRDGDMSVTAPAAWRAVTDEEWRADTFGESLGPSRYLPSNERMALFMAALDVAVFDPDPDPWLVCEAVECWRDRAAKARTMSGPPDAAVLQAPARLKLAQRPRR